MTEPRTTTQVEQAYQAKFGTGWRKELAAAMGVARETASRWPPKFAMQAEIVFEFLNSQPPHTWPERWSRMRDMAINKDKERSKL